MRHERTFSRQVGSQVVAPVIGTEPAASGKFVVPVVEEAEARTTASRVRRRVVDRRVRMEGPAAAVANGLGEHHVNRLRGEAPTVVGRHDVPARLVHGLAVALNRPVSDAADPSPSRRTTYIMSPSARSSMYRRCRLSNCSSVSGPPRCRFIDGVLIARSTSRSASLHNRSSRPLTRRVHTGPPNDVNTAARADVSAAQVQLSVGTLVRAVQDRGGPDGDEMLGIGLADGRNSDAPPGSLTSRHRERGGLRSPEQSGWRRNVVDSCPCACSVADHRPELAVSLRQPCSLENSIRDASDPGFQVFRHRQQLARLGC